MKLVDCFSCKDRELLKEISIVIEDVDYTIEDILILSKEVYKKGYMNIELTYAEAEQYKNISEKLKLLTKLDIEKIKEHTSKEFEEDYYLSTVLMHGAVWNNPERINIGRKNAGKDLLNENEYVKYKEINRINTEKFNNYMKYLEDKYGENLDAVSEYYVLSENMSNEGDI